MTEEFITKNTKKSVKIIPASFKDAIALKKQVLKSLKDAGIIKDISLESLKNLEVTDVVSSIANLFIEMDMSDSFDNALFSCLKVCIYDNKHSITEQLFDDIPELQEDYYEIITKCCEVNLRPFFKSLVSELSTRLNQIEIDIPELSTPQTQI